MPENEEKQNNPPVGAIIQKKFLEERKIFLWGRGIGRVRQGYY